LEIKKEEISPKISSLELNLYPIHYVIIIVIRFKAFKNSLLEKRPYQLWSNIIFHPLDALNEFSRWRNPIHNKDEKQVIWQNLTLVFIGFF